MTNAFHPNTGKPQGGQHPIMLVDWTMKEWAPETREFDAGTPNARSTMSIKFKFEDVEPIELREGTTYPFPVAEVTVPYTDPSRSTGNTRWEALAASGRKLFGGSFELDDLTGKRQRWGQLPCTLRMPLVDADGNPVMERDPRNPTQERQVWGDAEAEAWQIVSVEGVAASPGAAPADSTFDYMADAAEGLDENGFHAKLIADQRITSNPDLVTQVTNRTLVGNMINMGKITRDEQGILHKTGAAASV